MPEANLRKYTLGLDLGSASLGWALVELDNNDNPVRLMDAGVRIFDPGVVGGEAEIEKGRDKSKASERRLAHQRRTQTHRRSLRQKKLFRLLQEHALLPFAENTAGQSFSIQRHEILNDLDQKLTIDWRGKATLPGSTMDMADQSLVYLLRRNAVDHKLEPFELGRILYHFAQRRGYWSSRQDTDETTDIEQVEVVDETKPLEGAKKRPNKVKVDAEKTLGDVAKGISSLRVAMDAKGTRYLGSYFATVNPHQERIRHRWTERAMFVEEFTAIWNKQKEFYPELLTDNLEAKVRYWLFFQRPLASANHLIGFCELEKNERRAPWATLEAQRFRLLQKVNDLHVIESGAQHERPLKKEERERVLDYLETKGDLTFKALKQLLGLNAKDGFNLERESKDKIEGNRVNVHMLHVFGERWNTLSQEEKHKAVEQWRTIKTPEKLEMVGKEQWQLDGAAARELANGKQARPPKDYCKLSRLALSEVLPKMEDGVPFKTVEREIYGSRSSGAEAIKFVPRVADYLSSITNPAVMRALTELRKVVNAIIREYGKPYEIRIELARELRKNRHDREKQVLDNKARQEKREKGARWILAQQNKPNPSAQDLKDIPGYMIDKWLLAEECGWKCPYTSDPEKAQINYSKLFVYPEFEVEHIIPLSRCTDNSLANKTLCRRDENQNKGGRTPWEAYHEDEDRWAQILKRVSQFTNGPRIGGHPKLRRFKLRSLEEIAGFTRRQLTDTRYTSKLAARLLMALYGGRDTVASEDDDIAEFYDKTGRRIFASTGGVTKPLRDAWQLHPDVVLDLPSSKNGENRKGKDRSDHRHHAVDALVIALTTEQQIKAVSLHAASKQDKKWPLDYRDLVRGFKQPWSNRDRFLGEVFHRMQVSHKPEHKLAAGLHKDGNYGKIRGTTDEGKPIVYLRIRVDNGITPDDIKHIVDENVRKSILAMEQAIGGFQKWSIEKHGYPALATKDGRSIPIKKVRISRTKETATIGPGQTSSHFNAVRSFDTKRHVDASEKHHVALFVSRTQPIKTKKSREKWVSECVSVLEAHRRHNAGQPIICKQYEKDPEAVFLFSLRKGDTVELGPDDQRKYCILTSIEADGRVNFVPINAAGKRTGQSNVRIREMADGLRPLNVKKVFIDLLGVSHFINESSQ